MQLTDKNKNSMERQLTEIIEKYLEGNYLVGGENKTKMISEILVLFNVSNCNCDEDKQLDEESYKIEHLVNDTYQVIGETSGTVWKQGTLDECNEWVML